MQTSLNLKRSQVISTYVYQVGLVDADFSFSAAVGFFNSIREFYYDHVCELHFRKGQRDQSVVKEGVRWRLEKQREIKFLMRLIIRC